MKTNTLVGFALAGLVAIAGAAQADNHRERPDFATLDANGDGALTQEELRTQAAARFAARDTNGDGALSAEELRAVAAERASRRTAGMIERLDQNGDGLLQQTELEARGSQRATRLFERADSDGNGTISAEEFGAIKDNTRRRGGRG
ncbi:EF-hand domain-containing protein [Yoonia sp. 2307UL14-13]|uniref:EF-hand domain-containing protein n=1 Tax=Yoonia sp. 2307UL14-13 TaxID=3126506 RepID=UPI0030AE9826